MEGERCSPDTVELGGKDDGVHLAFLPEEAALEAGDIAEKLQEGEISGAIKKCHQ